MTNKFKRETDDPILRVEAKIDEIRDILFGDGKPGNPSILIRLDRIEQIEDNRRLHRVILYTATIGLIVERVWHLLAK